MPENKFIGVEDIMYALSLSDLYSESRFARIKEERGGDWDTDKPYWTEEKTEFKQLCQQYATAVKNPGIYGSDFVRTVDSVLPAFRTNNADAQQAKLLVPKILKIKDPAKRYTILQYLSRNPLRKDPDIFRIIANEPNATWQDLNDFLSKGNPNDAEQEKAIQDILQMPEQVIIDQMGKNVPDPKVIENAVANGQIFGEYSKNETVRKSVKERSNSAKIFDMGATEYFEKFHSGQDAQISDLTKQNQELMQDAQKNKRTLDNQQAQLVAQQQQLDAAQRQIADLQKQLKQMQDQLQQNAGKNRG